MPVTYNIHDGGSFVEFVGVGQVRGGEMVACKLAMSTDPGILGGFTELCDLTAVLRVELDPDFFEAIVGATRACHEAHAIERAAVVVSRPEFFDLARQYERLVAGLGITVIVFNHRDTAMLWLGRAMRDVGRGAGGRVRPSEDGDAGAGEGRAPRPQAGLARRTPTTLS